MAEKSPRSPAAIMSLSCLQSSLAPHSPVNEVVFVVCYSRLLHSMAPNYLCKSIYKLYSIIQINSIKLLFPSMKIGIKMHFSLLLTNIQWATHRSNNLIKRKKFTFHANGEFCIYSFLLSFFFFFFFSCYLSRTQQTSWY